MGKGPATSGAAPPIGGPEIEVWVGTVQASVLLLESLRSLSQPHFTSPTSPGLSRKHVPRVGVASEGA